MEAPPPGILHPGDPMVPALFQVVKRSRETADTFTLELAPAENDDEFAFEPGQFNMVYAFGVGEVPISISGDPGRPGRLVHTIRSVGAVTNALSRMRAGDTVGIRGPYGSSWPVSIAQDQDLVIVAGGIGLAPLRPVIYHLLRERKRYRRAVLLYGTRTPGDILFGKELQSWRRRLDLEVLVTVDRAAESWRGNVGVVTTLIPGARFDPSKAVAMICGPEVMMRFTIIDLEERGVSKDRIYVSMERNMKCGIGFCGHCQFGPTFVCKNGPVYRYDRVERLLGIEEI